MPLFVRRSGVWDLVDVVTPTSYDGGSPGGSFSGSIDGGIPSGGFSGSVDGGTP
jgi:hypothetical protein